MHSRERFLTLLKKYTSDEITAAERDEFFLFLSSGDYDDLLEVDFSAQYLDHDLPAVSVDPERAGEIMQKVLHAERHTARILPGVFRRKLIRRWLASCKRTILRIAH